MDSNKKEGSIHNQTARRSSSKAQRVIKESILIKLLLLMWLFAWMGDISLTLLWGEWNFWVSKDFLVYIFNLKTCDWGLMPELTCCLMSCVWESGTIPYPYRTVITANAENDFYHPFMEIAHYLSVFSQNINAEFLITIGQTLRFFIQESWYEIA